LAPADVIFLKHDNVSDTIILSLRIFDSHRARLTQRDTDRSQWPSGYMTTVAERYRHLFSLSVFQVNLNKRCYAGYYRTKYSFSKEY